MGRKNYDLTGLQAANERRREARAYYNEILEEFDKSTDYGPEYMRELADRLGEYIQTTREAGEALTIAGMILASGMGRDTYYRMRNGELDYLLPAYMDRHDIPLSDYGTIWTNDDGREVLLLRGSDVIKNAELEIQADRERLCMDRGARQVSGAIFLLKAQQGLQDAPQQAPATTNQTLIIADREQAARALQLLGSDGPGE